MNSSVTAAGGIAAGTVILLAIVVIVSWCVPLIIALLYGLPRKGAIAALSLGLGWTGAGWLAAMPGT